MYYFLLAFFIGIIVAFLMYKNIKNITDKLDKIEEFSFDLYSKYSAVINEDIKNLKKEIEFPRENGEFKLLSDVSSNKIIDELSSLNRKLVFYETLLVKQKTKEEIERELLDLLVSFDTLVKENFENGEELSERFKDLFFEEFKKIKNSHNR